MRNLLICFVLSSVIWSCQKDSFLEERGANPTGDSTISVDPTDEEIFDDIDLQDPRASLDNSSQGLYRGVFSTYDGLYHGEIVINLGNNGEMAAAIHFVNGQKMAFIAETETLTTVSFRNNQGSFFFNVADIDDPKATQVVLNEAPGYIKAYKERSSRRISIALGHYDDSLEPDFKGNWDLISFGIREFNFPGAFRLSEVVISRGDQVFVDLERDITEDFEGCFGFDVRGPYIAQVSGDIALLEGKNQFSNFNGFRCDWNLSYSFQNNRGTYSDSRCAPTAQSGVWFWNGRNGRLFVDALRIN
ncbi:hypothetical protein [Gilvibacter sp. SZ-19]|uniref:hypothetical protein n=1 Tax=Gilvibacter sp. SZ-19 TaxID=754429 RepID=UPI0012F94D5E|nr:hypothetical protein [Gilvibacter sp. SZ-19]